MKIGDRVKFVSDTGVGRVVKINGDIVDVDIQDGFIMPCSIYELVVVQEEDEIAAIKSIGVGDERPGVKKGKAKAAEEKKKEAVKKEPAFIKYGRISLISDDDADDSDYPDMDRIRDIYIRNKAAEERREREFEEARERQEKAKLMVSESSESVTSAPVEEPKATTLEELAQKMKVDMSKVILPVKEKKADDIEVVDLHAKEILECTENMSSGEIITAQLSRFTIALDLAINSGKHGKIVFIHGVGSGKLKMEMQKILRTKYPKIQSQDASFREYGYGAIMLFY